MSFTPAGKTFLFSVDLEDVRHNVKNGKSYEDRVRQNTNRYLCWLERHNARCTFFVTGHVARDHPGLIREIIEKGHEIACHTTEHLPLEDYTADTLYEDLVENISCLKNAGASEIMGFRAPTYSLTSDKIWVYSILKDLGFKYSSSVLPAKNPLYGWPSFGRAPREVSSGIVEIPLTVGRVGHLVVPVAAGVYFRVIPYILLRNGLNKNKSTEYPLVGYFHPYDIDQKQEKFMQPGVLKQKAKQ